MNKNEPMHNVCKNDDKIPTCFDEGCFVSSCFDWYSHNGKVVGFCRRFGCALPIDELMANKRNQKQE